MIDLVMPVYNEANVLPAVLASLENQVDASGIPLDRDAFRIIAVNNASTDDSRTILEDWTARPLTTMMEPEKGVVAARILGADLALQDPTRPIVVHADSDSIFPPLFITTISECFREGGVDVLSYLGFEPTSFWRKVPRLAHRQFLEVGSISFSPETIQEFGFHESEALLTPDIFRDFENVPTSCGFAMTKDIYRQAGGYLREFNQDGTERLGEARNLAFRLDRAGARFQHVLTPPIEVNPRRYLLEAEDLWAGRSYTQGMTDLRDEIRPEHYARLDESSTSLDYDSARRNAIQRFIVDPCIARPERLARNPHYFGASLEALEFRICDFHRNNRICLYVEARPFSDQCVNDFYRDIVANIRKHRRMLQTMNPSDYKNEVI